MASYSHTLNKNTKKMDESLSEAMLSGDINKVFTLSNDVSILIFASNPFYVSLEIFNILVSNNHHEMVKYILDRGCSPKICPLKVFTEAVSDNKSEIVISLIKSGIITCKNINKHISNFIIGITNNNLAITAAFLEAGIFTSHCPDIVFRECVLNKHIDMVNLLINAGYFDNKSIPGYTDMVQKILILDPSRASYFIEREITKQKKFSTSSDNSSRYNVLGSIVRSSNIRAIDNVIKNLGPCVFKNLSRECIFYSIRHNNLGLCHLIEKGLYLPKFFSQQHFERLCENELPLYNSLIKYLLDKRLYSPLLSKHSFVILLKYENFEIINTLLQTWMDNLCCKISVLKNNSDSKFFSKEIIELLIIANNSSINSYLYKVLATRKYNLNNFSSECFDAIANYDNIDLLTSMLDNHLNVLIYPSSVFIRAIDGFYGSMVINKLLSIGYDPNIADKIDNIKYAISARLEAIIAVVSSSRITTTITKYDANDLPYTELISVPKITDRAIKIILDYIGPEYNPDIDKIELNNFSNILIEIIKYIRMLSGTPRPYLDVLLLF